MPTEFNFFTVDLPKPKIIEIGFSDNHFLASSLPITKKPLGPSISEVNVNPPSRSAKLRVAEKI